MEESGGQLIAELETHRPELVIFTFTKTAQVLFGAFGGNGFVPDYGSAWALVWVFMRALFACISLTLLSLGGTWHR